MRFIEATEIVMEYNTLLKKIVEANIWFGNPKVSQEKKDAFEKTKYDAVWERLGELSGKLEEIGITYKVTDDYNEVTDYIELPEALKRKDVEGFLENWIKVLRRKEQEKEKVGA